MTVSVKFDRLSPLDKKNALAFIGGETAACRNFLSDSERSIPLFEKKMKKICSSEMFVSVKYRQVKH